MTTVPRMIVATGQPLASMPSKGVQATRLAIMSWRIVRRAAGHEQRDGALTRIFGASAVIALVAFGFWFLVLEGPAPSLAPR